MNTIPTETVGRDFIMNPRTEDLLSSGDKLRNGMIVLVESSLFRGFSNPEKENRWCEVSEFHLSPTRDDKPLISFVGIYADGYKTKRTYSSDYAWLVKKEVAPSPKDAYTKHRSLEAAIAKLEEGDFLRATFQYENGQPWQLEGFVTSMSSSALSNESRRSLMLAGSQCVRQHEGSPGGNLISIDAHFSAPKKSVKPEPSPLEKAIDNIKDGEFVVVTFGNNIYDPGTNRVRGYAFVNGNLVRVGGRTLRTSSGVLNLRVKSIEEHYPR